MVCTLASYPDLPANVLHMMILYPLLNKQTVSELHVLITESKALKVCMVPCLAKVLTFTAQPFPPHPHTGQPQGWLHYLHILKSYQQPAEGG